MKRMKARRGYSLLEMIIVLALLMLFGVTTISLIISGSKAYNSISAKMADNSELRIASSYVNMRIRQNDAYGLIRIEKNPVNGAGNALVISEPAGTVTYETWIYYDSGMLREGYVAAGENVTNSVAFEIANIDGFEIELSQGGRAVTFTVRRGEGDSAQNRSMTVGFRTGARGG